MTPLTKAQIEAMLALRPGPLEVRKKSNGSPNGWRVVNQAGDAVLGDWELAECWWKADADADAFAALHDLARTAIALHDMAAELEGALRCFLADDRFQVAVGGNPNVVEAMLTETRATLERTTP